MSPKTLKTTFYPCYSHGALPNAIRKKHVPSYFQNKEQGKLEYSMNTSIFKMYDLWQCYMFGTKVFNFLYVTILNVGSWDTLGAVEGWPLSVAGVTQLDSQTHNFGSSAPSQSSPRTQQDKSGQFCSGSQTPPPQKARKGHFISMQKQLQPAALCPKAKILTASVPFTKSILKWEKTELKII